MREYILQIKTNDDEEMNFIFSTKTDAIEKAVSYFKNEMTDEDWLFPDAFITMNKLAQQLKKNGIFNDSLVGNVYKLTKI